MVFRRIFNVKNELRLGSVDVWGCALLVTVSLNQTALKQRNIPFCSQVPAHCTVGGFNEHAVNVFKEHGGNNALIAARNAIALVTINGNRSPKVEILKRCINEFLQLALSCVPLAQGMRNDVS